MSDKAKSAELIMRLYELRREEVMRQARTWFFAFQPETVEDVMNAVRGEHSAYYRMITSYWDMACSFVNHGAIDEEMFNDANQEHVLVFSKIRPLLEQLRAAGNPTYMQHLEKVVMGMKGLYPNVDFFAASVYRSLGIPTDLFTPVFAISRMAGWTSHVIEQQLDNRLIRPDSEYIGPSDQRYVPIEERTQEEAAS